MRDVSLPNRNSKWFKVHFWVKNFLLEKACAKLIWLRSGSAPRRFEKPDPDKNRPDPQHLFLRGSLLVTTKSAQNLWRFNTKKN
jgi:hypothetical protein